MKGDNIMSKVNCTVTNCFYNKTNGCTASAINVDGEKASESRFTNCATFIEQKPGIVSSAGKPQQNSQISCVASNCMYNKNQRCNSDDILVNGKNAKGPVETCCSTFKIND
jgi:hypothetical protein